MAKRHYIGILLVIMAVTLPASAKAKLTLRINDAVGVPGGQVAIVVRTYASRPIEQGQLCLEATPAPGSTGSLGAATTAPTAEIYSTQNDVTSTFSADLTTTTQQFVLNFNSPSGTVNSTDGPLAVFFIELSPALVPGQTYDLVLDAANTHLFDPTGAPVEILPRSGLLTIRDPLLDPVTLRVDAEDAAPGDNARVSVNTLESLPLASGRIGILYDASIASGPPVATSDPRYGNVQLTLDYSVPGLALIDFTSPDGSFNHLPGNIISLYIPTALSIPAGTETPVSLDLTTSVQAHSGKTLNLVFFGDVLRLFGQLDGAGEVVDLQLAKLEDGTLDLSWDSDCGDPGGYSVYRGELALGYASTVPVAGQCTLTDPSTVIGPIQGVSEFFIVVPHLNEEAGGYSGRTPPAAACFPQEMNAGACAGPN